MSLTQEAMNDVASLVIVHALFLLRAVDCSSLSEGKPCPAERVEIGCNRLAVIFASAINIEPADPVQSIRVYRGASFATTGRARDSRVPSGQMPQSQRRLD